MISSLIMRGWWHDKLWCTYYVWVDISRNNAIIEVINLTQSQQIVVMPLKKLFSIPTLAWDNNVVINLNYINNSLFCKSILCIFFYFQHGLLKCRFVKDIKLKNLPRWGMCHLMAFPNVNCANVDVTKTWQMSKLQECAILTKYTLDLGTLNEITLTINLALTQDNY